MNWIKRLFKKQLYNYNHIKSITVGERDENGFCDTYVNGEKSNVRLMVWEKEEVEKLQKISDKIHNKNINNK